MKSSIGKIGIVAALIAGPAASTFAGDYVAHEWGTFTSVQGSDGIPLSWHPLKSSDLPDFVYDWEKPGYSRASFPMFTSKSVISSLQRMETPVIYFYAREEQSVDVRVDFPLGTITEWYPQAREIGPALVAGTSMNATNQSPYVTPNSRVHWTNVRLTPGKSNPGTPLPSETSASHYFAARATDSSFVNVDSETNSAGEHEKFLFYRGVGNFITPLNVTESKSGGISITNTGIHALNSLLVLNIHDRIGSFVSINHLKSREGATVEVRSNSGQLPLPQLISAVSNQMCSALVGAGLYSREASAMVNTWTDSWFSEDGTRVLYLLPESWTERTLPLTLAPKPSGLVRVMVGRAELIPQAVTGKLQAELSEAAAGNQESRRQAIDELKKLGRFAEPAVQLATNRDDAARRVAYDLLASIGADGRLRTGQSSIE